MKSGDVLRGLGCRLTPEAIPITQMILLPYRRVAMVSFELVILTILSRDLTLCQLKANI